MVPQSRYDKYRQQQILSLTAGEQIVLLFDETTVVLLKAIDQIEKNDIPGAHNSITKAQDIFQFLIDNLNMTYPLSSDLFKLYDYAITRLIQANIKKDVEIIREIHKITKELADTWREAEKIARIQ